MNYTCKKCNRRYEYNADVGYSRDNICGPYCDGLLRGESKSQSRIAELEAELAKLREQTQWRPIDEMDDQSINRQSHLSNIEIH